MSQRGRRRFAAASAALLLVGLAGCASVRQSGDDPAVQEAVQRSCVAAERLDAADPAAEHASAAPAQSTGPAPGAAPFSPGATQIAGIIGVLPLLPQVPDLRGQPAPDAGTELAALRVRQQITDQILLAMLEVASVHAQIDCEEERGAQLRDHLQKQEDRRGRRLGLTSVLLGAATALLSGGAGLAQADALAGAIGAVGGTAEGAAGLSLMYGSTSGELRTEPNMLREVWDGPERSALLPASVWRFLNRPVPGDSTGRTVRQALLAEWRSGERLGRAGSKQERTRLALLMGPGGMFAIDDLLTRDAMLDILRSQVSQMSQDLERLLRELVARARPGGR